MTTDQKCWNAKCNKRTNHRNSYQNVLTFSNVFIILILEINSQLFDSFLKFNDNFQWFIDSNCNPILSFIQRFNVVFQFFVELRFQISSRYDVKVDNNACLKWIEKIRDYIDFYDKRDDNFSKIHQISLIAFYLKNFVRKLWFVRKIKSNSLSLNHSDKIKTLKAFFAIIKHAFKNINEEKRSKFEYYSLCQIISVWKYAYVLLQLIEKLSFKSLNVKTKKIFKINVKNHVREILFRIHN